MKQGATFAVVALLVSGCVYAPNHGDHVGTRSSSIYFSIFGTQSAASFQMTCSHHYGNTQTVSTFTGGTSPTTLAGETVYATQRNVTLPSSCWESWSGPGYSYITYVRVLQNGYNAMVYDQAGLDCLHEQLGDGVGPITAGYDCRYDGNDILLFANP